MTSLLKSKTGQAPRNVMIALISIFVIGFTMIFMSLIGISVLNEYQANAFFQDAASQTLIYRFLAIYTIFDYVILFFLFALILSTAYTSFKLRTHPAFFVVTIILTPFYGLVSYFFNYMFVQLVSQDVVAATLTLFPITYIVCTNLHWVTLGLVIISAIALYAKVGGEGGLDQEPLS